MIEPSGNVKLMDFGIAKLEAGSNLTSTGLILGTPNDISPEQAKGDVTGTVVGGAAGVVVVSTARGGRPPSPRALRSPSSCSSRSPWRGRSQN